MKTVAAFALLSIILLGLLTGCETARPYDPNAPTLPAPQPATHGSQDAMQTAGKMY